MIDNMRLYLYHFPSFSKRNSHEINVIFHGEVLLNYSKCVIPKERSSERLFRGDE